MHALPLIAFGFALDEALRLALRGVRRLAGLASARERAEALRDAADARAQDAENKLRLAECDLASQGRPVVPAAVTAVPAAVQPRVTARRIER